MFQQLIIYNDNNCILQTSVCVLHGEFVEMYFLFSSFWDNNSKPKNICYTSLMLSFHAEGTLSRPEDHCPVAETGCLTTTCFNSGLWFMKTQPDCSGVASFNC